MHGYLLYNRQLLAAEYVNSASPKLADDGEVVKEKVPRRAQAEAIKATTAQSEALQAEAVQSEKTQGAQLKSCFVHDPLTIKCNNAVSALQRVMSLLFQNLLLRNLLFRK